MALGFNLEEFQAHVTDTLGKIEATSNERAEAIKKTGEDVTSLKAQQEAFANDLEVKFAALEKMTARVASVTPEALSSKDYLGTFNKSLFALNKASNREHVDFSEEQAKSYCEVFKKYLQFGKDGMSDAEKKSLSTASDPSGGYLVIPEVSPTLINKKFDAYGIIEDVHKQTTAGRYEAVIDFADYDEAYYNAEAVVDSAVIDTKEKYAKITFNNNVVKYGKQFSRVSLEDAFINVESDVFGKMQKGMARTLAEMVTKGTGNGQPKGLLMYPAGTDFGKIEQVESTASGKLVFGDLISVLPAKLKDPYHANAGFYMQRRSFFGLLAEVDLEGRYQLAQMINFFSGNGFEKNILGYRVKTDASMPEVTAGALAVAFGDLDEAYILTTTPTVGVVRDDVTNPDYIKVWQRERHDGKVVNFEAIKLLKIKA